MIKSRRLRWPGNLARMEGGRSTFKILTSKHTRKRPLWRLRWEDYIRINHKKIGLNMRNWIDTAHDRDYWRALVNASLNLWTP